MISDAVTCRRYREGDESRIVELFKLVFERDYRTSTWEWAYKCNPQRCVDAVLAFSQATLVGYAGAIPLTFNADGHLARVGRIQNVMVHPEFRRQGIFTRLLQLLAAQLSERGAGLAIAFPNDNSLPTFIRKEGYRHVAEIPTFNLPAASVRAASGGNIVNSVDAAASLVPADVHFMSSCLGLSGLSTHRSLEYMHWRYHADSGRRYWVVRASVRNERVGLAVCKLYSQTCSVDVLELACAADRHVVAGLLAAIRDHCGGAEVQSFNLWSMDHYPLHGLLLKMGFTRAATATHLVSRNLSGADLCAPEPRRYYLSMGDSDVY